MDLISMTLVMISSHIILLTTPVYSSSTNFPCPTLQKCDCKNVSSSIKVDCRNRGLVQFPNFTYDVVYIDLSSNSISEISKNVIIPNTVGHLDVSDNRINYIDRGVLGHLPVLRYLDISYNRHLSFETLPNITYDLQFTSVRILKLNGIQCEIGKGTRLRFEYFKFLSNTSLEEIGIASNRIEAMESNVIQNLPKTLERVDMSDNRFIVGFYLLEILYMENIKFLNFSFTSSNFGPNTALSISYCFDGKKTPNFPTSVIRGTNMISSIHFKPRNMHIIIYFPRSLEAVDVSHSLMRYDPGIQRVTYEMPNLKKFYSQSNFMSKMYGLNLLRNITEYVDLSNNYCTYISPRYFENATSLRILNLSNNYLGLFFRNQSSNAIFKSLGRLEHIDLSTNGISQTPLTLLAPLKELRHLVLASNYIEIIELPLDQLKKLSTLDLSANQIRFISSHTMMRLDAICKQNKLSINLNHNMLLCSCETLDFLKWMQNHLSKMCITFIELESYKCTYTNLTELSLTNIHDIVDELSLHCSSDIGLIAGSVTVVTLFLISIVSAIFYRYRWRLRYLYYTTKTAFYAAYPGHKDIYKYDVFLSYTDEDRDFTHREILQTLEGNDQDITVCCHTKDFTPGRPIADNIAAAVHDSRFTVCVVSKSYTESYWCMYEFNLAKMETEYARGGENATIVVLMNDIPSASLPLSLLNHIESESYLEVPRDLDVESRLQFAERLRTMIL